MTSPAPTPPSSASPASTGSSTVRATLRVEGMHCDSCAALIGESLTELEGVDAATVDLEAAQAEVEYDPSLLDVGTLTAAVVEAGYTATPVG